MFQIARFKIIFTNSTEILSSQILLKSFFSKPGSAGLNYHLPKLSFITGGGDLSYKHCLLTFFIFLKMLSVHYVCRHFRLVCIMEANTMHY